MQHKHSAMIEKITCIAIKIQYYLDMSTLFPFIGSAFVFLVIAIAGIEICKKRKILDRP